MSPTGNGDIAELAAREAESAQGHAAKALRRVSRKALGWPVEAQVAAAAGNLRSLDGVGPFLARVIGDWLQDGVEAPDPPQIREGFMTYSEALRKLEEHPERRLRGDLQSHSTWSDGRMTLEELAEAAIALGHEYVAVTDHSKGLKIAGGMDEEELLGQMSAIDSVNEQAGTEVLLRSIEMNLSISGESDMDPGVLRSLDLVLGSFHSKLRLTEDQTDRYVAALRNPDIHVLAHPKGRIYNFRLGLEADWPRVFAEATSRGKAVEIDGFPDRQDLSIELASVAANEGCYVSIGSDAHRPSELGFATLGSAIAIDAGIEPGKILNLMTLQDLKSWVAGVRERSSLPAAV